MISLNLPQLDSIAEGKGLMDGKLKVLDWYTITEDARSYELVRSSSESCIALIIATAERTTVFKVRHRISRQF